MKFGWKAWLGVAFSAAALWYAMRGVDFHEVGRVLAGSNWGMFIASGLVATLVFPLRAYRWRVILEPVVDVPVPPLWRSIAIGMMVNNVAPARAGEIARAFAVTREDRRLAFSTAVASLAVDRVIDAVVVVVMLVLAVMASNIPADTMINGWTIARTTWFVGGIAAIALAGLFGLAFFPSLVTRLFDGIVGRLTPGLHRKLSPLVGSLLSGFAALRSPMRFARIVAWAVAMWLVNSLAFYLGFLAVGIDAPFTAAVFVQSLVAIGVSVPSTPGFFGVFEFFGREGLSLFGVPADQAISWGFGYHFVSFIPITVIGLYYFSRLGMRFGDLGETANASP